jgi:hypothetical protein
MIPAKLITKRCFHIKLGSGDEWSKDAINAGKIYFGYRDISHAICQTKREDTIRNELEKVYQTSKGKITDRLREIMTFYTESEATLWITFYKGYLYYATAKQDVFVDSDDVETRKYRKTTSGWSCLNINKEPISEIRLRGDLVTKKYYRGTICSVPKPLLEYLLRVINCEEDPIHQNIRQAHSQIGTLVRRLGEKDFELLVDMIMQRSGIMRESGLGGTMKDIDYAGSHPLTKHFYYVQIKSRTDKQQLEKYLNTFIEMNNINPGSTYMYILNDDSTKHRSIIEKYEAEYGINCQLLGTSEIGQLAAKLGLIDWILDRT